MTWRNLRAGIVADIVEASLLAERAFSIEVIMAERAQKERDRKKAEYAAHRPKYKARRDAYRKTDRYRGWAYDYYQIYNRKPERRAQQNKCRRLRMQDPKYRERVNELARAAAAKRRKNGGR